MKERKHLIAMNVEFPLRKKVYLNDHISATHGGIKHSPREKVLLPNNPMNSHI